jgi:hypothetical protein
MSDTSPSRLSGAREDPAAVVLLMDQQVRWRRGEHVLVEAYLAQQPHLRDASEVVLELILHEVLLRQECGETPTAAEYQQRFPHLAEQLAIQFEVEQAIDGSSLTPGTLMQRQPGAWLAPPPGTANESGADLLARRQILVLNQPPVEGDKARVAGPQDDLVAPFSSAAGIPRLPADDPTVRFSSGLRIPGYEILAELGRGGMGIVYRARHLRLNRVVALKMVLSGGQATPEEHLRFMVEVEAIATVKHPGIVQVHDFGTHDGLPFLSLEFCAGGSLAGKLASSPLPPRKTAPLVEQVARAVQAAHDKGIVHRDLKPGNVLLDEQGQPRVTDFGLAKRTEIDDGLTRTGAIIGTPSYAAPEQAQGRKDVGPAADVYALGAILYECLTGRPPFKAATTFDTLFQVVHDEPVPPRQLNPAVPRDLETICLKCLHKDPNRRYGSAAELAEELRRWQAGEPILARPVGSLGRMEKWVRRSPLLAGLGAVTVLALLGGTIVSTYFAVDARQQQKQALMEEGKAREAVATMEENLALGLLRPLGHFENEVALNDFELDALEELASLPHDRDRVRLLFIEQALETEGRAGQLNRRLHEAVIAAVGLRRDLREKVLAFSWRRMQQKGASRSVRVVCARLAGILGEEDHRIAKVAAHVLLEEMAGATAKGDQSARVSAFAALSTRVTSEDAAALGKQVVERAARSTDRDALRTLAEAFAALAEKIPEAEAGRHAAALGKQVVERADETTDAIELRALTKVFAALVKKIPEAEASKHAVALGKQVVELAFRTTKPSEARALAEAFASLAGKIAPTEAPALGKEVVALVARTTDPAALRALAEPFASLAGKIAPTKAAALGKQVVERAAGSTNRNALPALAEAFASLAGKIAPAEAAALGKQVVERAARTTDRDALRTLAEAFAALAEKIPEAEAGRHAAALGKQVVERAARTTDPSDLHAFAEVLATLTGKIPEAEAGRHAAALCKQVVERAGNIKDADQLYGLSQAVAALTPHLSREQKRIAAGFLASRLARIFHRVRDDQKMGPVFEKLCRMLSPQQLIDLLKQPGCVEPGRPITLECLGHHSNRRYHNVWELVEHVEGHVAAVDCSSPFSREQHTPEAARRVQREWKQSMERSNQSRPVRRDQPGRQGSGQLGRGPDSTKDQKHVLGPYRSESLARVAAARLKNHGWCTSVSRRRHWYVHVMWVHKSAEGPVGKVAR